MPFTRLEPFQLLSEEKSSSIGTMIVVAIAAGLIGYVIGKPNQAQEEASKPTEPAKPDVPHAVKWNGHWYALVDDKDYTITEAREKAKALGGHLPYINSKEEEELILFLAKEKRAAIGLVLSKDGWSWGDGSKIDYINWGEGGVQGKRHPNETHGESGDFVILRDKAWVDINKGHESDYRVRLILEWE